MIQRLLLTLLTLSLLSGCGFRLQGQYLFPDELDQVQLASSDRYGELHRLVTERLRLYNIEVVSNEEAPRLWLGDDRLERTTLSLFPSGQVAEYELIYSVRFSVTVGEQEPQPFDIEIRRDYLDDPRTALAKNRELELLLEEMRAQAADQILRALAATRVDEAATQADEADAG
ncbi:LPS-assembly lipoprotein LptE [Ferrimonas marina]|uniref:LPS-assembly lipoprotein LptE n=1 Tax=Ferrimonas marina TaxID=299255 RepID=A0A1M5VZH0_9GAMM|nr:LPS-assembly lipoprotein [Ferrimonas marina]